MPELCAKLKTATGVTHRVDSDLIDYPVFVSVKSGEPERVKKLVAEALRGTWVKDGESYKLMPAKMDSSADYEEFERQFKLASAKTPGFAGLPIKDVYKMAPGAMLRFGTIQGDLYRPFTSEFRKKLPEGGPWYIVLRRFGQGVFESKIKLPDVDISAFDDRGEIEFDSLPPKVEQLLKPDLDKVVLTADEEAALRQMVTGPDAMKVDWSDLSKRDPIANIADGVMPKIGKAVSVDMAIALPDLFMMILTSGVESNTVRARLARFSQVVNLDVVDGAVIGKSPICDRFSSAQVKRKVLEGFIGKVRVAGVANIQSMSEYVNNQRPAASASWVDAMMLVMSGIVLDDAYIGDYPYNVRLYTRLARTDWALLESGQAFSAGILTRPAQEELYDLLVSARARLDRNSPDPGLWRSLAFGDMEISATIKQEDVLIGFTSVVAEVRTVADSALMHEMRMKSLKREPLYQPAKRRRFELTITSKLNEESVKTGFSEVTPSPTVKPSTWDKLPAAIAAEYKKALESRKAGEDIGGVPPP